MNSESKWLAPYQEKTPKSRQLYERAIRVLPMGSARSSGGFHEPYPLRIIKCKGSRAWDVDGNEYIDHNMAGGCLILGHANDGILRSVYERMGNGTMLMPSNDLEVEWAEKVLSCFPSIDQVRATLSGSEACEYGIRLAKAYTRKRKILKFEGAYHGQLFGDHPYSIRPKLSDAGSAKRPIPVPESRDLELYSELKDDTLVAPFNDSETAKEVIEENRDELACVIVEPVLRANIPPVPGFLQSLRSACDNSSIPLILDEVVTGFRLAPGGAQEYYGVRADITILGKAIAGGLPMGAFGASQKFMDLINERDVKAFVHHQGTHNAQPLSTAASISTIDQIRSSNFHATLNARGEKLRRGLKDLVSDRKLPAFVSGVGSMWSLYFTLKEVTDYRTAMTSDARKVYDFHMNLILNGLLPIVGSVRNVISAAHSEEDIDRSLEIFDRALATVR